jgi:DNA ligase-1
MSNLYTIIKELQNASGSNAKTAILEANKDNELLKAYLKAVYDPSLSYYQTNVKTHPVTLCYSFTQGTIQALVKTLVQRELTGDAAKKWLDNLMKASNKEAQELIQLLIKRSIGAGVGDTMILKVFPDLYFIPPYQRCSLMDAKVKDRFSKLDSFFVQEKLDGSFCYLVKEAGKAPEAITRAGSKYPPEFAEKLAVGLPDGFVVVGELLVYGEAATLCVPLDRKTGNGILNSVLKGGEVGDNLGFELTAWDCLTVAEFKAGKSNVPYTERLDTLDVVIESAKYVQPVTTNYVQTLEEAYEIYSRYTAEGKEGCVIKSKDFLWRDGTSKDCIKLKIEFEVDLKVVGMTEGTGKAYGTMGSLTLSSSDGLIVTDVGTGFSDKQRKDWWETYEEHEIQNYNIIVTVKANDIISKRDSKIASLFLPVFIEERLDKTEADSYVRCVYQLHCAKNGGVE